MAPSGPPNAGPAGHDPAHVFADRTGVVTDFDERVGAGTVVDDDSGDSWWFHCTRIAGHSRTVDVGASVRFRTVPGPTGLEAVQVTLPPGTPER